MSKELEAAIRDGDVAEVVISKDFGEDFQEHITDEDYNEELCEAVEEAARSLNGHRKVAFVVIRIEG